MDYTIVKESSKIIAGLSTRTNNNEPEMSSKIGGVWQRLFGEGVLQSLKDKRSASTFGVYHNYENDVNGDYDFTAGCSVGNIKDQPENLDFIEIPEGKYAKFTLKGKMDQIIGQFWSEFWKMNLDRAYTYDFEEYLNSDPVNSEVNIYIALK